MPAEVIDTPSETGVEDQPPRSSHFGDLVKSMETTMGEPQKTPETVADMRPKTPPEVKPEPKRGEKPPVKPEAQQPDAKPDDTITSPKAADWKKLKAHRDELQTRVTESETLIKTHSEKFSALEKEYNDYRTKTSVDPKEIDELKKRNDDLNIRLERHALSENPKFKSHYESRFNSAVELAVDALGKEHSDLVKAIMDAPKASVWRKQQINQLMQGMEGEFEKQNLAAAIREYDKARDERADALQNHQAHLREWKATQDKEVAEQKERQIGTQKKLVSETLKHAEKFEAFKTGDDAEHNAQVVKNRQMVEDFIMMGRLPDSVVLMMPVLAAEGERLQKVVPTLEAKVKELEEALAKYQTSDPKLEGKGAPTSDSDRPKGFVDQVLAEWPGVMQQPQR